MEPRGSPAGRAMTLSAFCCVWFGCHLGVGLLTAGGGGVTSAEKHHRRPPPPAGRDLGREGGPLRWRSGDLRADGLLTELLSTLNLTEQNLRPAPEDYMEELYERFSGDLHAAPSGGAVVRSFKNQDSSPYSGTAEGTQTHPLLFTLSVPAHERLRLAELRLYTAAPRSPSVRHQVTVYQRRRGGREATSGEEERLVTRRLRAGGEGWMALDLTHVVEGWRSLGQDTHRLEVYVEERPGSEGQEDEEDEEEGKVAAEVTGEKEEEEEGGTSFSIERNVDGKRNAVMVVFSDDPVGDLKMPQDRKDASVTPLPGTGDAVRGTGDAVRGTADENRKPSDPPSGARLRRAAKSQPCRRSALYVDFKDIGWDQWVIQPQGYEAYECHGVCNMPMTSEVSPTKHAMVQTLLSHKRPQKASRACCVPTKLDAIPLLYHDNGVVTFNHKYEGMVVAECGCR